MSLISKQASSENGSFYVLQSPNSKELSYHIGELFLAENSTKGRIGFFKTYDESKEQSLRPSKAVLNVGELSSYLKIEASPAELRLNPTFEGKKAYEQTFKEIQKVMASKELQKAVLFNSSVMNDVEFPSRTDFYAYCLKLLKNQKTGYLFGFYNPKLEQAYLGISPEFLCREGGGYKYTTAVAGTRTAEDSDRDTVDEWSDKLVEEHSLVKRGVAKSYDVEWSETTVQKYGKLRHLKAEGLLKTKDSVEEISSVLHPTSAVGTLPHEKSYAYTLGNLSQKDRGHFGGYVFFDSSSEPFSLVTIRGVEWSNNRSIVCIGGGVLPESILSDEWSELERKWEAFKSLWRN